MSPLPLLIGTLRVIGAGMYSLLKLLPAKNKVVLISRRNQTSSIEFQQVVSAVQKQRPETKIVILNHMLDGKVSYVFKMVQELFHLATAHTAILDSYTISVSMFKHKKSLRVVQMWHALGALKKFGYEALDTVEGSTAQIATLMRMHRGYTHLLVSSNFIAAEFQRAFGVDTEVLTQIGTPRIDYLLDADLQVLNKELVSTSLGLDMNKTTILYAPTFRKNEGIPLDKILEHVDERKYNFVFSAHPLDTSVKDSNLAGRVIVNTEFDTLQLLSVADVLVTDYSAISFESILLNIPTLFWAYDHAEYSDGRGLVKEYDDLNNVFYDAEQLMDTLDNGLELLDPPNDFMKINVRDSTTQLLKIIFK